MSSWQPATNGRGEPETCPHCKAQTEHDISKDSEDNEMVDGERCNPCDWEVQFTDEGVVRIR